MKNIVEKIFDSSLLSNDIVHIRYLFLIFLTFSFLKSDIIVSVIVGITLPSTYAMFDKYNQPFYGKGFSLNDVVMDSFSALFGTVTSAMFVGFIWPNLTKRRISEDFEWWCFVQLSSSKLRR